MRAPSRSALVALVVVATLAAVEGTAATPESWRIVTRGQQAGAGELALVGSIVRRPGAVAVRALTATPQTITLQVVMSCRRGLATRVARQRPTGRAPFTKTLQLPLTGADNCAVSATGRNPSGTLRLVLLRGA
jgi:hypothetical protein